MNLFINKPELFYTINLIPGIIYNNYSLTLWLGGISIILLIFVFLIIKKIKLVSIKFNRIIIYLFLLLWSPLFINFFYNNIYDLIENITYSRYSTEGKRIVRLCNIDNRGNTGGLACKMFSFIKFSEKNLERNSKIKLLTGSPFLDAYFRYYLYPNFSLTEDDNEAEYLLYYFDPEYSFKDNTLYKKIRKDNDVIEVSVGEYTLINSLDLNRFILKSNTKQ
ncbi:MAG: hypothetical protein ABIE43_04935 [Patescibacteria group bacterium]